MNFNNKVYKENNKNEFYKELLCEADDYITDNYISSKEEIKYFQ